MTRRATHWHNGIIERSLVQPARPAIRSGLFHVRLARRLSRATQGLTRRATHRHNDIIETSLVHPRGQHPLRVFSSRFRNRTVAAHPATHSRKTFMERRSARRRPNHCWPCTRERAGPRRRGQSPAPLRSPEEDTEIGFAPETIALRYAICRAFSFRGEMMTAYLISLAIAGLIAIVLWETFS